MLLLEKPIFNYKYKQLCSIFSEGHAYKKAAHGIVSRVKSEISDAGQISGYTKIRQYGKFSFLDI